KLQVVGPADPIVAVAGEDLVLPCFIKPNTSAVDMTVEWLRLMEEASLVHLYKDLEDIYDKQAQPYSGRTSLFKEELQKGNASLKLSALRVSDEGEYKCLIYDKSWYDDVTVYVTVEALGSHPVIMMENYDNSGGIHLVCESRGWNPEPEILWLNREGDTLPAEDTQTHRDTEGFSVKCSITVYDYSDSNRFYCRLLQKHHYTDVLESVSKALVSLQEFTDALSSENYISVSYVKPILYLLNTKILAVEDEDTDLTKTIKSKILNYINKHYEDETTQELLDTTKFLDPRFKTSYTDENKLPNIKARVISDIEMSSHKVMDVTLDPDSAHPKLILSPDGKQVRCGDTEQNLTDTSHRFIDYPAVVGNQSFSSGRFYYEVQVRGKTHWRLGVMRENINRKEKISWRPQDGVWTVRLWGDHYEALDKTDVSLTLKEKVEKLGVFVDYDEGLVSFYDVNSRFHIYSFTGQKFTEKLIPFF
ncbi:butyrophilin-like protein 3, partial [Silurus meridionalis]